MHMAKQYDEDGWRVPTAGTQGRQIYDLLKEGKSRGEIADALSMKGLDVSGHIWRIKGPVSSTAKFHVGMRVRAKGGTRPGTVLSARRTSCEVEWDAVPEEGLGSGCSVYHHDLLEPAADATPGQRVPSAT